MMRLAALTAKFTKLMSALARHYGLTIVAGSHPVAVDRRLMNIAHVCLPNGEVLQQRSCTSLRTSDDGGVLRAGTLCGNRIA